MSVNASRRGGLLLLMSLLGLGAMALIARPPKLDGQTLTAIKSNNLLNSLGKILYERKAAPWISTVTTLREKLANIMPPEEGRRLCVIARAYGSQASYIPLFLLSIAHMGINTRVYLVNTDSGMTTAELGQGVDLVNALLNRTDWAFFLPFEPNPNPDEPDYGYLQTDQALKYLYDGDDNEHRCEHVLVTNADNFYVQDFGQHLAPAFANPRVDLIGYNFVSRYQFQPATVIKTGKIIDHDDGTNLPMDVEFSVGRIDLGAAIFRFSFLKSHQMFFARKTPPVTAANRRKKQRPELKQGKIAALKDAAKQAAAAPVAAAKKKAPNVRKKPRPAFAAGALAKRDEIGAVGEVQRQHGPPKRIQMELVVPYMEELELRRADPDNPRRAHPHGDNDVEYEKAKEAAKAAAEQKKKQKLAQTYDNESDGRFIASAEKLARQTYLERAILFVHQ